MFSMFVAVDARVSVRAAAAPPTARCSLTSALLDCSSTSIACVCASRKSCSARNSTVTSASPARYAPSEMDRRRSCSGINCSRMRRRLEVLASSVWYAVRTSSTTLRRAVSMSLRAACTSALTRARRDWPMSKIGTGVANDGPIASLPSFW